MFLLTDFFFRCVNSEVGTITPGIKSVNYDTYNLSSLKRSIYGLQYIQDGSHFYFSQNVCD